MCMHTWENPEIHQIWTLNQANQNDWSKETWKKCPINVIQAAMRVRLSLWARPRVYPHILYSFFLLINTLLVSLLSVFVGILFLQSRTARALSLTTGLVARIRCSHCRDPTSITGRELKSCFKPLQAKATRDHIWCRNPGIREVKVNRGLRPAMAWGPWLTLALSAHSLVAPRNNTGGGRGISQAMQIQITLGWQVTLSFGTWWKRDFRPCRSPRGLSLSCSPFLCPVRNPPLRLSFPPYSHNKISFSLRISAPF